MKSFMKNKIVAYAFNAGCLLEQDMQWKLEYALNLVCKALEDYEEGFRSGKFVEVTNPEIVLAEDAVKKAEAALQAAKDVLSKVKEK